MLSAASATSKMDDSENLMIEACNCYYKAVRRHTALCQGVLMMVVIFEVGG